jgi:hypothetical protein
MPLQVIAPTPTESAPDNDKYFVVRGELNGEPVEMLSGCTSRRAALIWKSFYEQFNRAAASPRMEPVWTPGPRIAVEEGAEAIWSQMASLHRVIELYSKDDPQSELAARAAKLYELILEFHDLAVGEKLGLEVHRAIMNRSDRSRFNGKEREQAQTEP